jgi:hypothetical protein
MHFVVSRYLALLFAIGLGIGETIISWGHWQFAPLWIVDYLMVVCLLYAYYKTRKAEHVYTLLAAWAFTVGVFYMDLFVNLDPQLAPPVRPGPILLALIGFMLALSLVGFFNALFAVRATIKAPRPGD